MVAMCLVALTLQSVALTHFEEPDGGGLSLADQTAAAGITLVYAVHGVVNPMFPGAAAADFDRDGWQDLFLLGGGVNPDALYRNNGDGTFTDVAPLAGLAQRHVGSGVAAGDYDGDGWLDLFVTSVDNGEPDMPKQQRLYRNNGDGTFTDVADAAGVSAAFNAFSAAFGDYDLDGDLDLAVTSWTDGENRLYRNEGNGAFTDVTATALLRGMRSVHGFSVRFADMDGDRYPELLWVADYRTTCYLVNNRDGTFSDRTGEAGAGRESNGMGHTVGDFNNDGLPDWYVTSIYNTADTSQFSGNMLYWNLGAHVFQEGAAQAGVLDGGWGWGTVAVDLNHDGLLDIVETNGWMGGLWLHEPSYVFLNQDGLRFVESGAAVGCTHTGQGRGLLHFDYDNDGDQDVLILTMADAPTLYRNDLRGPDRHWLRVFLDARARRDLAPDGVGARVEVAAGGRTQMRLIDAGSNYLAQSELSAHFGLGSATEIDALTVQWPNGQVATYSNVSADQTLTLRAPRAGDLNADGRVDLADLARQLAAFGRCAGEAAYDPPADLDRDGCVLLGDVELLLTEFGLAQ